MFTNRPAAMLRAMSAGVLAASSCMFLSSCGGGGGGGSIPTPTGGGAGQLYAYVLDSGTSVVSTYKVGADGSLASSGSDETVGAQPAGITVDPQQRFLYVPNQGNSFLNQQASISVFTIGNTGMLSAVGTTLDSSSPFGIGVNSSGKYAIATNVPSSGEASASIYSINQSTGALTLSSTADLGAAPFLASPLILDPGGPYAYIGDSTSIQIFKLSSGTLTANSPATLSIPYTSFSPTGKFAYGAGSNGIVYEGVVQSNGNVTANSPGSVQTTSAGGTITIGSNGKYAYIADSTNNRIEQFSVSSSGLLAPLSVPSVAVTGTPYSVIVDPLGRFLYVNIDDQQHPAELARFQITNGALVAGSETTVFSDGNFHAVVFATK